MIPMRKILTEKQITPSAALAIKGYYPEVIEEIEKAIVANEWVIVGVAYNPFVVRARKFLTENDIKFLYIEHGSYTSGWKPRLAIKMWSGWPTFPQIFHETKLVGGFQDLIKYQALKKNESLHL